MTKVIFSKDIRKAFTDKVNEYLAKGMEISIRTMSGSQGEIGKIDLTDGQNIYRIRLERDHSYIDKGFFYGGIDTIELIIEKYEDDGRDALDTWGTLWSGKGELIEKKIWYSIEDRKAFTDSFDEILRLLEIRTSRRKNREIETKEITDSKRISILLKIVKKRRGYSSVTKKQIAKITKSDAKILKSDAGYMVFFTNESRKMTVRI